MTPLLTVQLAGVVLLAILALFAWIAIDEVQGAELDPWDDVDDLEVWRGEIKE